MSPMAPDYKFAEPTSAQLYMARAILRRLNKSYAERAFEAAGGKNSDMNDRIIAHFSERIAHVDGALRVLEYYDLDSFARRMMSPQERAQLRNGLRGLPEWESFFNEKE